MKKQFNSKTKYMVIKRFIKYILYSLAASTIYIIISFILDKFNLFNTIGIKNELFMITMILSVGILGFLIFALMKIISFHIQNNSIFNNFSKTDGYINLIYTFAYAFISIYSAIIMSSVSAAFNGLDYLFVWLFIFSISMNLFTFNRSVNVILLIMKHIRETD